MRRSRLTWHKTLRHLNLHSLRSHLKKLDIDYINEPDKLVCDSCQRAKLQRLTIAIPKSNQNAYTNSSTLTLLGLLLHWALGASVTFLPLMTFTETYTGVQKNDWFRCLKEFYNLAKTRSKELRPTKRLQSDDGSQYTGKSPEFPRDFPAATIKTD